MSFVSARKGIFYLKRTGKPGDFRYWYWHAKWGRVGSNGGAPRNSMVKSNPIYEEHPWEEERELQVGDSVFHYPEASFGVLISKDRGFWIWEARLGGIYRGRNDKFELVWSQLLGGKEEKPEANLVGADSQKELEFAEMIGSIKLDEYIEDKLPNIRISKRNFLKFHGIMFEGIYSWAGKIRQEPVYVGTRDWPVCPPEKVENSLDRFFGGFYPSTLQQALRSREHLRNALVELHRELAWIHPFYDGNGRVIRYFCFLLALESGYRIEWGFDRGGQKRRYHRAVRLAAQRYRMGELRGFFDRVLVAY